MVQVLVLPFHLSPGSIWSSKSWSYFLLKSWSKFCSKSWFQLTRLIMLSTLAKWGPYGNHIQARINPHPKVWQRFNCGKRLWGPETITLKKITLNLFYWIPSIYVQYFNSSRNRASQYLWFVLRLSSCKVVKLQTQIFRNLNFCFLLQMVPKLSKTA